MTIGNRIMQIRKENGLSQELFAHSLDVSRQTVSKWEANAVVPEMEKLIKISQIYHVSIEWLLCMKEERNDAFEFNEHQLKIIENIMHEYTKDLPRKNTKKQKLFLFGIVLLALYLTTITISLRKLQNEQQFLNNTMNNTYSSMHSQLSQMETNIENILNEQNSLSADHEVEIKTIDYKQEQVTFQFSFTPKTYVEDSKVEFIIDNGKDIYKVFAEEKEGHMFVGEKTISLSDYIRIKAILVQNEKEHTLLLDTFYDLLSNSRFKGESESLENLGFHKYKLTGNFTLDTYIEELEIKTINTYLFADDNFIKKESLSMVKDMEIYYSYNQVLNTKNINNLRCIYVLTDSYNRTYVADEVRIEFNNSNANMLVAEWDFEIDTEFEYQKYD